MAVSAQAGELNTIGFVGPGSNLCINHTGSGNHRSTVVGESVAGGNLQVDTRLQSQNGGQIVNNQAFKSVGGDIRTTTSLQAYDGGVMVNDQIGAAYQGIIRTTTNGFSSGPGALTDMRTTDMVDRGVIFNTVEGMTFAQREALLAIACKQLTNV